MKLREQALLKVEPQVLIPTSSRPAVQRYPWKMNIVTTVFWVGEEAAETIRCLTTRVRGILIGQRITAARTTRSRAHAGITFQSRSSRGRILSTSRCLITTSRTANSSPEAPLVIPWFKQSYTGPGQSVCRHRWIAIRKGNRLCYAQWEDCGPFRTDHFQYVFGNERPKPNLNHGAGLMFPRGARLSGASAN